MTNRLNLKRLIWGLIPVDQEVKKECRIEKGRRERPVPSDDECLREASAWLCRAQDSSPDKGVSRAYKAARYQGYGKAGWQPSYPETTGYIIPTFFALTDYLKDENFSIRAFQMAEWEMDIQMENGAVMGSVVTAPRTPAVFNTGQVIFGWLESYRRSGDKKYLEAARKAGDFLISVQEKSGAWQKGDSRYAQQGATTYNARVAWALIRLGLETKSDAYIDAGRRNIDLALQKQNKNGWFADNCLNDPDRPLLHTIVYATRGILEAGIELGVDKYIFSAERTLDALTNCQRQDGGIAGRLSANWESCVTWDCITGDAQLAIAWLRAASMTGKDKYEKSAQKVIAFIKGTQNLVHTNPGIRGGIKGSFPFEGDYGQYELLNWAAKFFCDALLMRNNALLARKGIPG